MTPRQRIKCLIYTTLSTCIIIYLTLHHTLQQHNNPIQLQLQLKPTLLLHIGPLKTGSTTLQSAMRSTIHHLHSDGYQVITPASHHLATDLALACCLSKVIEPLCSTSTQPEQACPSLHSDGNLLWSNELLSTRNINITALAAYTNSYNVTIIMYYRRYYQWLASMHNEKYKKVTPYQSSVTLDGLRFRQPLHDYISTSPSIFGMYTRELLHTYQPYFKHIIVMNVHDKSGLWNGFICKAVQDAHHTCHDSQHVGNESLNTRRTVVYQDLAHAAHSMNLIQLRGIQKFKKVSLLIQHHQEETLNLTALEFEFICPEREVLEQLLEDSLVAEEELVPEFFRSNEGENGLRVEFEEWSRERLCSVDLEKVLLMETWQEFFRGLRAKLSEAKLV